MSKDFGVDVNGLPINTQPGDGDHSGLHNRTNGAVRALLAGIPSDAEILAAAQSAVGGVVAPIQAAVNDARVGVVDGAFGLAVGIQDAAANSLYSTQNPAAEYDPVTNRTYIAYLATSKRDLFVRYLDHANGQLSRRFYVKSYGIPNYEDNHGAPSVTVDRKNRTLVIFDGVHGQPLQCSVSGADMDLGTWTTRNLTNFPGTYTSVCYEPTSQALFATFRRDRFPAGAGGGHVNQGATGPNAHEYGGILKSTDGGATWAIVATVNTKAAFPSDAATDYYVSDLDAFNGRIYVSFAIAHGASHDGPRWGVHVYYLDPADNSLHAVDGTVVDLTTAAGLDKIRVVAQDFTYPIKTAVNPAGEVVTTFNIYDSVANYVRVMAAKFTPGTGKWTISDTGVYSNYLYNGTVPAWRANRWEILTIRNTTGDNVVASTGQRDNLSVSSGGGDLVLLTSPDALTWSVSTTWDADRFSQPLTYVQAVRNAHPGLIGLVQPVTYGVMTDKGGNAGTGEQAGYNVSNWISEIYFVFAQTNLPASLNITRRPEVRSWHNPIYYIHGATATRVAPPADWTAMSVVPEPLPRGTTKVRLKVVIVGGGTAGAVTLSFRGTSYRDSDDQVSSRGEWTEAYTQTVEVPVGPDGKIEWKGSAPAGTTAAIYIRSHDMGALQLGAKTQKILTPLPPVVVTPGDAVGPGGTPPPDTTAPTAPSTVTATAGDAQATLAPTGATDNVAVTAYKAYAAATGGTALATSAGNLTVTGLTNGTAYTFYVSALDAAGNESTRTASNAVTPTAGAAPVLDSKIENFSSTSSTTIPNWTQLGSNADVIGVVDASGATTGGTFANAVTKWWKAPTDVRVTGANQRVRVAVPDQGTGSTMTAHAAVRGADKSTDQSTLGTGYWVRWTGGVTNQLQLFKATESAGTVTTTSLGTFALATRPTSIYVEAYGTSIRAGFNDGAPSITATDASISTVGVPYLGQRVTASSDLGTSHARSITVSQIAA